MAQQEAAAASARCCLALLFVHSRGLALLLVLLLLLLVSLWLHLLGGAVGLLPLHLHNHSGNLDNEPPAPGGHLYSSEYTRKLEFQISRHQRSAKRMMLLSSRGGASKSGNFERKMLLRQPGSRPPPCHNECKRCQGGSCVATPSFSRGSSGASQHAVWTCSCLH